MNINEHITIIRSHFQAIHNREQTGIRPELERNKRNQAGTRRQNKQNQTGIIPEPGHNLTAKTNRTSLKIK